MKRRLMWMAGSCAVIVLAAVASSFGAPGAEVKETPKAPEPVTAGFGKIKLTGLLQGWFQYDDGADPESTFRLRRAELKASGEITPEVAWWLGIDPAQVREDDTKASSVNETNYLTSAGRKSVLQDFAVSLKPAKSVSVDVGQYKVPFGMEGLTSSAQLDFAERAAMASQFKWADARDIGVTLRGDFKVGEAKIQPAVGVFNGEGQNRLDVNDGKMVVGRLVVSPVEGLHLGAAHADNEVGTADVASRRTGFEAKCAAGPVSVYGEYAFGENDGKDKETYYVTMTYKVLDALQLATRYDWYDPDTDADDDEKTEITLGINYLIAKHNAKIQLNYVFRGEEGPSMDDDVIRVNVQAGF